jgi:preprotein translocase subunit YajC
VTELFSTVNFLMQAEIFDPNRFNNFLILGYFVMWLIVMAYIFILSNKQKNAREDINLMKQLLKEDEETEIS